MTASTVSSVKVGNPVTITCTVVATPSATTIVWRRNINNQATTLDITIGRYSGGTISNPSLTINSVVQEDQGQYTCQAINSVGTGSSNQVYLTVTGGKIYYDRKFKYKLKYSTVQFLSNCMFNH